MYKFRFLAMSILSLVIIGFAGCKNDDDPEVKLTGIKVEPASIADLAIGGAEVTLKATAEPAGAAATFSWSANPADKVEISSTAGAEVKVKGLVAGATVITVSSGDVKQTVNVTVLPNTITDFALSETEAVLVVNGSETITATHVPPNVTGVIAYTATSSAAGIVEATAVGAEITLTGKGSGKATVTVTSGGITKTIDVTVISAVFQDAAGYWEFEDANDLSKRTYGEKDLLVESPSTLTQIDGPSANNKAVQGVKKERELALEHGITGAQNSTYTVMWDVQIPAQMDETWGTWFAAFWNQGYPNASLQFRYNNYLSLGMGSQGWDYVMLADYTADQPAPWMRVVAVIEGSEGDNYVVSVYKNGEFLGSRSTLGGDPQVDWRFKLNQKIYFLSDGEEDPDGRNDDTPHPLSALAFWSRALDAAEIATLGGL